SSQSRCVLNDKSPIFDYLHRSKIALMQTALFRVGLLPPPTAGPGMLSWPNRARTRLAANRGIALIVQGVVGDIESADYGPDLGVGPRCQRVVFLQPEYAVVLGLGQFGTRYRLITMLPR